MAIEQGEEKAMEWMGKLLKENNEYGTRCTRNMQSPIEYRFN